MQRFKYAITPLLLESNGVQQTTHFLGGSSNKLNSIILLPKEVDIMKKNCLNCRKEFETCKETRKYCSTKCCYQSPSRSYKGNLNPRWKGGRSIGYLLDICKKALIEDKRDLTHCERCDNEGNIGIKGGLNIHHKDKNRDNNLASNLEVICYLCHRFEHMEEWKRSYHRKYKLTELI